MPYPDKGEVLKDYTKMEELFIWFNRTQLPVGYPLKDDTVFKPSFDAKNPKGMPDQPWKTFNHHKMSFPPTDAHRFPVEMYLVVTKKYPSIQFDYFDYSHYVKLVSGRFLSFIQEKGLTSDYYEKATLHIVDVQGNSMAGEEYYALRFGKFDDQLFEFPIEGRKRAAGLKDFFLYPNLSLKAPVEGKSIFALFEFCYNNTLVFTKEVKEEILDRFHYPEVYKAEDYPFVFNNQYKWDVLPFDNEYKQ